MAGGTHEAGFEAANGTWLQDFASVEEARALMEAPGRHALALHGEILKFEYSIAPQPTAGAGTGDASRAAGAPLDWVCGMCQAVNFSRRAPGRGPKLCTEASTVCITVMRHQTLLTSAVCFHSNSRQTRVRSSVLASV